MPRVPFLRVPLRLQITQSKRALLARPLSSSTLSRQNRLPASYYRGGSSRAVFFNSKDLPSGNQRYDIFCGVIGSPDPYGRQLDGMGGGISSLSKVCTVGPSTHPEERSTGSGTLLSEEDTVGRYVDA